MKSLLVLTAIGLLVAALAAVFFPVPEAWFVAVAALALIGKALLRRNEAQRDLRLPQDAS